jgi:hypothetical protein
VFIPGQVLGAAMPMHFTGAAAAAMIIATSWRPVDVVKLQLGHMWNKSINFEGVRDMWQCM